MQSSIDDIENIDLFLMPTAKHSNEMNKEKVHDLARCMCEKMHNGQVGTTLAGPKISREA